ncbi:MAG: ATP-binding protein, partial [Candidatus Eiseniibacteriota bacterium]
APNNLPRLATSFVGRENELWECAGLLDAHRLVTLAGMGGAGKTRLALRLAERRLHAYPGGVWFVELASVADPTRVVQGVAAAIGVLERGERPLAELVEERLGSERTLLVLDNCEHIRDASAAFARRLLEACGGLVVLATSREPLALPGERVFRVPPMGLPPAGADADIGAIANAEAVRLFVARAASAGEGFALGDTNAGAVADICRLLDGIPLAIELVAARTRMLSVEEIRRLLGDRFQLVSSASATTSERHRTLRAAIDWSYELLAPDERRTLRALAVFRGGWTLAAAAAVCAAGDSLAVLDGMTRLAEKSLMLIERDDANESRYRMLETVRFYALEQLEAEGEADALRNAHLEHYRSVAEAGDRAIWTGEDQAVWLDRLGRDHENLLAALGWARADSARAARALLFAASLYRFWYKRGHYETARVALERVLEAPGAQEPDASRAQALVAAAGIAVFQGRYEDARSLYDRCLAIWRALDASRGVARTLGGLALVNAAEGQYREARTANEESLGIYRGLGDAHAVQIILHNQGEVALCEQAWEEARRCYEESLTVAGDDQTMPALTLGRLALVAIRKGDVGGAHRPLARALRLAVDLKATDSGVDALEAAAEL